MARYQGATGGTWDYVQTTAPADAEEGEDWFNSEDDEGFVFDGGTWQKVTVGDHAELGGVSTWQHLDPEDVEDVVAALVAAGDNLGWTYDDANDALQIDTTALDQEEVEDAVAGLLAAGDGVSLSYDDGADALTVAVADGSIGTAELSFDPATQSELNNHADDTTNPHEVTHHQTGAADALTAHSDDATAHHTAPSFGMESGEFTKSADMSNGSSQTFTVSFSTTFDAAVMGTSFYSQGGYTADESGWVTWHSWTTDGSGQIDGAKIEWFGQGGVNLKGRWNVLGVSN